METLFTTPEVRSRGAPANELEVDQAAAGMDIAEEATEAVAVVEVGIERDRDARPRPGQPFELAERVTGVALVLAELRCVDLDETDPLAALQIERVPVTDAGDGRGLRGHDCDLALRAAGKRRNEGESREREEP
jgi:hypothetical protein